MINWLSGWAGGIIVAVIIATIIEMILPEGNSKKYIKVVIGIYILFTIISPVISKVTGTSIKVSDILELNEYIEESKQSMKAHNELNNSNEQNIKEIYIASLKKDIESKIKYKGYGVESIDIEIKDDEEYTLKSMKLSLRVLEDNESTDKTNEVDTDQVQEIKEVNEINIQVSNNEQENNIAEENNNNTKRLSTNQKNKLKEYLSGIYQIAEREIIIE